MTQELQTMPVASRSAPRPAAGDSALARFVAAGARDWGVSTRTIWLMLITPFMIALAGAGSALVSKSFFKLVASEDGIAETLQVGCYAVSIVLSLLFARLQWRAGSPGIAGLYLFVACGLVFMCGEELDWGQRIFGWQTPEAMEAINKQNATNLHNIYGVGATFKWVQLLVGAYGTILPFVVPRWRALAPYRAVLDKIVPPVTLVPYFALMFAWRVFRTVYEQVPQRFYLVVTEYNEVIELALALGATLFLVYLLRRERRASSTAELRPAGGSA